MMTWASLFSDPQKKSVCGRVIHWIKTTSGNKMWMCNTDMQTLHTHTRTHTHTHTPHTHTHTHTHTHIENKNTTDIGTIFSAQTNFLLIPCGYFIHTLFFCFSGKSCFNGKCISNKKEKATRPPFGKKEPSLNHLRKTEWRMVAACGNLVVTES
jgi:hypothetical protein